ncbi:MAG: hypothetical protein M5U28_43530 [Sandaracinaceae bacterium]|nr:hypothetical protein [Sandaracinaceae bacterium]
MVSPRFGLALPFSVAVAPVRSVAASVVTAGAEVPTGVVKDITAPKLVPSAFEAIAQ